MERIIIARMDNQLGPKQLYQYPPAENPQPKEKLLKIWALHETKEDENSFINFTEDKNHFLSLSRIHQNIQYFIVIIVNRKTLKNSNIFREMLENIAEELLTNLDNPHFIHILHESFDTIKNYTQIDEEEMLLRLFQDKIRISILQILQMGTISKLQLKEKLKKNFGYANINLELFLAPFLRLKLIDIKDIHGITGVIFIKHDIFCCRLPPEKKPNNPEVLDKLKLFFSEIQILNYSKAYEMVQTFKSKDLKTLLNDLKNSEKGLEKDIALEILSNNHILFEKLQKEKILYLAENGKVYLFSMVNFIKFKPIYIINNLIDRYEKLKITEEQLINQIEYLKNYEPEIMKRLLSELW